MTITKEGNIVHEFARLVIRRSIIIIILISLLIIGVVYIYRQQMWFLQNLLEDSVVEIAETPSLDDNEEEEDNGLKFAAELAKNKCSFFEYLKEMDQRLTQGNVIPPRCRTVEFFLDCRTNNSKHDLLQRRIRFNASSET
jgi:hypothetical protein